MDRSSIGYSNGSILIIRRPKREKLGYALKFGFLASSNHVEHKALIAELQLKLELGTENL